jgi:hypothetical protein
MPAFGLDLSDFGFLSLPFAIQNLLCNASPRPSQRFDHTAKGIRGG